MLSLAWYTLEKNLYEKASKELVEEGSIPLPKPSHTNHPTAKWVRQTTENYSWASEHLLELYSEYDKVYCLGPEGTRKTVLHPKTKQKVPKYHSYRLIIEFLCNNIPPALEKIRSQTSLTVPHLAMPKRYYPSGEYTSWDQAIQSYRAYYLDSKRFYVSGGKRREFIWSQGRSPPDFWVPTSKWNLSKETEAELCKKEKEQSARKLARKNSKKMDVTDSESTDTESSQSTTDMSEESD